MPGEGGGWYCAGAEAPFELEGEAFVEAGAAGAEAVDEDDVEEEEEEAGAPGGTGAPDPPRPAETVTIGEIFAIVALDTPARERSPTVE